MRAVRNLRQLIRRGLEALSWKRARGVADVQAPGAVVDGADDAKPAAETEDSDIV